MGESQARAREVQCFVVYPEVKDKATTIVLIHEIYGLTDWACEMADELAAEGYIVIAPDLLTGSATNGGGTEELIKSGGNVGKAIRRCRRIKSPLIWMRRRITRQRFPHPTARSSSPDFAGAAGNRFALHDQQGRESRVRFLRHAADEGEMAKINCPVYGFYGGNDARVTATVPRRPRR